MIDDFTWTGYAGGGIPVISVTPSSLSGFTYVEGSGPSAEQSFTISGSNLTEDIIVAAPTNYEISTGTGGAFSAANPITLSPTSGNVASTPIYVRLKAGLAYGTYNNETITASSSGADDKTVTCNGLVSRPIGWANLQWPDVGNILTGGEFNVYGRVYAEGVTEAAGANAEMQAWIGYSTQNTDPATWTNWVAAGFNAQVGNNDEYMANIGTQITVAGTYYYASRFQLDGGPYVYGGYSAEGGGFWDGTTYVSNVLTITYPEPTNHVTSFSATSNSSEKITVTWTDATGAQLPAAYLIKGSSVSYGDIAAPQDGTPEADAALVKNIDAGIETASFSGLSENTTYYFKIWPYTNSGTEIDYKTDGAVPEATATTGAATAYDNVETFDNFGATGTSYSTGTFIGQDGSTWNYIQARGDYEITEKALMLGRNRNPQSEVYSGTIGGGIQILNFDYMQAFSNNVNLNVLVNNVVVGNVTSSNEKDKIKNSGDIAVNVTGNFVLKFINVNNNDGQVVIDNISWNSMSDFSAYNGTGNWTNASNWSKGLPGATTDVIINGNVTVNDYVECMDITISPVGAVTVGADQGLIINGNFLIESGAAGTGSFIGASADYVITGTTTVQRYIPGAAEAWHLLSSPVAAQNISGDFTPSGTYGDGTGYDFYAWDEPTETWLNQKVAANNLTSFAPAKGYLVAYQATNPTKTFTGTLNDGIYYPTLTVSGTQSYQHSNLLGNPYPSSIDWKNVTGLDKANLVVDGGGHNMYIWNEAAVNYGVYNDANSGDAGTNGASRYIAPMQGFFVIAANAGDFGFDNDARVHNTQSWLKSGNDNALRLSVTAPANAGRDEVMLDFGHESSQGGADKWFSMSADAPALYVPTPERDYSIRFLTNIVDNPIIPVAFKAGVDGEYSIQANFSTASFSSIKLIDQLLGTAHELSNGSPYNFTASTGDDANRFALAFGSLGIDKPADNEGVQVFAYGGMLYVQTSSVEPAVVNVYNLTGQLVMQSRTGSATLSTFNASALGRGVYVVNVIFKDKVVSRKVVNQY
ncbi:hypothetical protein MASR1M74_24130 [Lentimicrobium sp.]